MKYRALFISLFLFSCTNQGGSWQHYRLSAFDEARTREMTIYLHFYTDKNPVCEKQKEDLENLIKDKAFKNVGAYRVNFGTEKVLQNFYSVREPCVLLVFKGDQLKTRIASDVGPQLFKIALEQGLSAP